MIACQESLTNKKRGSYTRKVSFTNVKFFTYMETSSKWKDINLITPPGTVDIYSLAVNPKNGQEMFYGTDVTLYKTIDGGKSWITKKMPSSRAASALLINPDDPNIMYMGVKRVEKKK